ncbi:metallo-sulfur cluster assembly [Aureococcus anophagefferens]|nr:metallo-sulfur cluster assembly [Aureococcus anophagefferens]
MHRAVLSVRGGDAAKLIHSLTTNNVTAWMESATPGLAAAFLNTKGRVLADAVLWRDGAEDILVDCPASAAKALLRHLKMYKLRSDVKLKARGDLAGRDVRVARRRRPSPRATSSPAARTRGRRSSAGAASRPRARRRASPRALTRRRLALGVAEGAEVVGRIPLNCNLDALRYVAFDKGCYLGQELTARAKFRGEVRRRLMPVALQDAASAVLHNAARALPPAEPVPDAPIVGALPAAGAKLLAAGKAVGEVVAVDGASTVAVAMLKLDFALSGDILDVDVEGTEQGPFVPAWWPEASQGTAVHFLDLVFIGLAGEDHAFAAVRQRAPARRVELDRDPEERDEAAGLDGGAATLAPRVVLA